ncbi:uracil-DNA glycosylase [Maribacter hydrothermalis]|uniref:Uracil-DNA glycosylase n=1 Tax=Maribacter hydrothermalis TaxID=1836467 RepID=A0A1B7Z893_9FLAO|nr:uracil-DNA glycosylase [Maribacter hydrothermalis]APQ19089.1 uracil-DNA glycosylase [Maribacter hydrothermalis]OBR38899.1 uracil-DNA glycosylase [Maribacter hydrothermalis]
MKNNIPDNWKSVLQKDLDRPYFQELLQFIQTEYKEYTCYPPVSSIFSAFKYCSFNETKVVIIGQDPYHNMGQANGLCFSVKDGIKHPPSLVNIFKEIENDLNIPYPESGNLEKWAKQGVLLLNATLTVREHRPGSHQNKGWEKFTDSVIMKLSEEKSDIIFMLWGGFAKKKAKLIDARKHHILTSGHPSPLSANRGYWFGNKHFSNCNKILTEIGNKSVVW